MAREIPRTSDRPGCGALLKSLVLTNLFVKEPGSQVQWSPIYTVGDENETRRRMPGVYGLQASRQGECVIFQAFLRRVILHECNDGERLGVRASHPESVG